MIDWCNCKPLFVSRKTAIESNCDEIQSCGMVQSKSDKLKNLWQYVCVSFQLLKLVICDLVGTNV